MKFERSAIIAALSVGAFWGRFAAAQTTQPASHATVSTPAPIKLADACKIRIVDGLIDLESDATETTALSDFKGRYDWSQFSRNPTDNTIDSFTLVIQQNIDGAIVEDSVALGQFRGGFGLQFHHVEAQNDQAEQSFLMQRSPRFGGFGPGAGQPPLSFSLTENFRFAPQIRAARFEQLIASNPQETEQYIRPMLRDLHNEDLLPPADLESAQVFADDMPANAVQKAKIDDLVSQLNSENPDERESASAQLHAMHGEAIVALLKMDRSQLAPEQQSRISALIGDYKLLTADEIKSRGGDCKFLLAALASDNKDIRDASLRALRAVTKKPVDFDTAGNRVVRCQDLARLHDEILPSVSQ